MPRAARASNRPSNRIVIILLARSVTTSTRLVNRLTRDAVSLSPAAGVIHGMEDGLRSMLHMTGGEKIRKEEDR